MERYCEYETKNASTLSRTESSYYLIPESLIKDTDMDRRRILVYLYFSIKCGDDDSVLYSIPRIVAWSGNTPNANKGKINDHFIKAIRELKDCGYIDYTGELKRTSYLDATFNIQQVKDKCRYDSFARVYLDEIMAIVNYKKTNPEDINNKHLNNGTLLLVFAYLRNVIYNRPNRLRPEEYTGDLAKDIEARRKRAPEAFSIHFKDIAEDLDISQQLVSRCVKILEEDLELITTFTPKRTKHPDGSFYTNPTIFANVYKREGNQLLAIGRDYYDREIANKVDSEEERKNKYKKQKKSNKGGD